MIRTAGTLIAFVVVTMTVTVASGQCLFPSRVRAEVGVSISTVSSRVSAPAYVELIDNLGWNCEYQLTATLKIRQDSPAITFTETFSALSPSAHTLDAPAQEGSCYNTSISASGAGKKGSDAAGPECWDQLSEPCDTCPRDSCEVDPASCNNSPLLVAVDGRSYRLTGLDEPVLFDINADGTLDTIGWPTAGERQGFVALDRNGNGRIDDGSELFGNFTPLPNGSRAANGFAALAALDSNGDGRIEAGDETWPQLLIWIDENHDGFSQAEEMRRLGQFDIRWLSYEYVPSPRRDRYGNAFRYKARFAVGHLERTYYDIYLVTAP